MDTAVAGRPGFTWTMAEGVSFETLVDNKLTEISLSGKRIGLLKRNGQLLAFSGTCPHAGAPLCDGWLDAQGRIVCPDHKYRFDPANGRNTSGEGYKLFTYPVELRGSEIWVGILHNS